MAGVGLGIYPLPVFAQQTMGGSFGNPGTDTYVGECVSYVRLYMEQVLGIETTVWGHAANYWTNPAVLQYFDRITNSADRRDGDILVWGDDPGTWTSAYGHIGIAWQGQILNQNFANSRRVTVNPFFPYGYLGALRKKGATSVAIIQNAENWFNRCDKTHWLIRGRSLDRNTFKSFVGQDFLSFVEACSDDPEADMVQNWQAVGKVAVQDKWDQQIYSLQAIVNDLNTRPNKDELEAARKKAEELSATADKAVLAAQAAEENAKVLTAKVDALEKIQADDKAAGESFLRRLGQFIQQFFNKQ